MIELVWDARRQGTGRNTSGASLAVGDEAHFSPDDLVSLAAASCLMKSFLTLAAENKLPLLSYLSTSEVVHDDDARVPSRVRVRAYVVAANDTDRAGLEALVARAKAQSPVSRLLGDRVEVTFDVRVLSGAPPAAPEK